MMNKASNFICRYKLETTLFVVSLVIHLAASIFLFSKFGDNTIFFANEDASSYTNLAKSLIDGQGFVRDGLPSAYRTPVYPLLLSIIYLFRWPVVWSIMLLQNIIASLTAVFLYKIGQMFFSTLAGKIASLTYIFEPYMLLTANLATTETLFNFLIIGFAYYFGRFYLKGAGNKDLIISTIFLGLAALTKPVAVYIPVVVFLLLIIRFIFLNMNIRKLLIFCLLFLVTFFAVLSPWSLRQYLQFGTPRITNINAFMLYARVAPIVVMKQKGVDYITAAKLVMEKLKQRPQYDYNDVINNFRHYDFMVGETKRLVLLDPLTVARFYAVSLIPTMFGTGYEYMLEDVMGFSRRSPRISYTEVFWRDGFNGLLYVFRQVDIFQVVLILSLLLWGAAYLLVVASIMRKDTWRKHGTAIIFLLSMATYFILFALGPASQVRYRMPSFPFIFLLVAFALDSFLKNGKLKSAVDSKNNT